MKKRISALCIGVLSLLAMASCASSPDFVDIKSIEVKDATSISAPVQPKMLPRYADSLLIEEPPVATESSETTNENTEETTESTSYEDVEITDISEYHVINNINSWGYHMYITFNIPESYEIDLIKTKLYNPNIAKIEENEWFSSIAIGGVYLEMAYVNSGSLDFEIPAEKYESVGENLKKYDFMIWTGLPSREDGDEEFRKFFDGLELQIFDLKIKSANSFQSEYSNKIIKGKVNFVSVPFADFSARTILADTEKVIFKVSYNPEKIEGFKFESPVDEYGVDGFYIIERKKAAFVETLEGFLRYGVKYSYTYNNGEKAYAWQDTLSVFYYDISATISVSKGISETGFHIMDIDFGENFAYANNDYSWKWSWVKDCEDASFCLVIDFEAGDPLKMSIKRTDINNQHLRVETDINYFEGHTLCKKVSLISYCNLTETEKASFTIGEWENIKITDLA